MTRRDMALAASVAAVWGLNFVVSALMLRHLPPFLFTGLRFIFVAFPAVFFVRRPRCGWRPVVALGICTGCIQFGLLFWAMGLGVNAGLASLLIQLVTFFTLLLAVIVLHERPTRAQIIGVAVGIAGLAIVAIGRNPDTAIWPIVLVLIAAAGWAAGNIVIRVSGEGGLSLSVWSALIAPVPMIALSLSIDGPRSVLSALAGFDWGLVLGFLYSSTIATLLGFAVWANLLSRNSASTVAPWSLVTPLVGMLGAWLVLDQAPTLLEGVGAVVILLGVLFASTGGTRYSADRASPVPT